MRARPTRARFLARKFAMSLRQLGIRGMWRYFAELARCQRGVAGEFVLHPPAARFALSGRRASSDILVFCEVFIHSGYRAIRDERAEVILDLGANVGYASSYFLTRYQNARVIAVEPDPENFELLQRNLRPYGERARAVQGVVWPRSASLALRGGPGGAASWAVQVEERTRDDAGATIEAYTMQELMKLAGERVSIVKMDIEGAEVLLFGDDPGWLDAIDSLAVELHDNTHFGSGTQAFAQAIAGRPFDVTDSHGVHLLRRRAPSTAEGGDPPAHVGRHTPARSHRVPPEPDRENA
jgi:FkbM family methyltransferase